MTTAASDNTPIGLFGGTFNPIHRGHIEPVMEVRDRLHLGAVHFVPVSVPSHREAPGVSADRRFDMLQLALYARKDDTLLADDREIRRSGPSFTIDTLEELREMYGESRPLVLILGLDAFLALPTWKRWEELLSFAHIAVMERPGSDVPQDVPQWWADALTKNASDLAAKACGSIIYLDIKELDISSTAVRESLATGGDPSAWIDDEVLNYVRVFDLYSEGDADSAPERAAATAVASVSESASKSAAPTGTASKNSGAEYSKTIADRVVEAMDDSKARDIQVLDVQGMTDFTDYMVIATGTSDRHLRAVADNVRDELKKSGVRPVGSEGDDVGEWVLIDLGGVVAHVMRQDAREFYDLDGLWSEEVRDLMQAQREGQFPDIDNPNSGGSPRSVR